ncbi:MAG: vWA domain-containing protein [Acidimicrobiales bacterium]
MAFVDELRDSGLTIPLSRSLSYFQALECLGVSSERAVYWAGRATLLGRNEDVVLYERCFRSFFLRRAALDFEVVSTPVNVAVLLDGDDEIGEDPSDDQEELKEFDQVVSLRFSAEEVLREKDFGSLTRGELDECLKIMRTIKLSPPLRSSQRLRVHPRGGRLDVRRTVRDALAHGGEPINQKFVARSQRVRRTVFICDISGSMEPYAKALIRFVHAMMVATRKVEVFTLGTRLSHVTRALMGNDPEAAMARAAAEVQDWSGGTRLGEGIKSFNDRFGVRGMARGATVVILSDGWDRGDPNLLGEEMKRLQRVSRRLIWVNPLKASEGYAPLAKGMAAALPYVDEFVEGHSLNSLESLAEVLAS